ncbi:hypothetical protein SLE2022_314190 [Rubroshorea leprosula]
MSSPFPSPPKIQSPVSSNPSILIKNNRRNNPKIVFVATSSSSTLTPTGSSESCKKHVSLTIDVQKGTALDYDVGRIAKSLPFKKKRKIITILQKDARNWTLLDLNHLLTGLVEANQLDLALKLYTKASSYGVQPDSRTSSIMIRCYCKKNDVDEARRVLDDMLQNGYPPNVATFTDLINLFCKTGKLKAAFEVFELMGVGIEPTVQTYNCLLKGLCYVGKVEKAYEMLMGIKKGSGLMKPDIYSYTAVMDGFCKVGRSDEAMELLEEALKMGLEPSPVTFNALFSGYTKEGRPEMGFHVLKLMKERNCTPDRISYSTLLNGLLKWGKIKAAFRVYEEMVGIGFEVDERMMNSLLRGLCMKSWEEKDLIQDAYHVFEEMRRRVCVDSSTYGFVIRTLCMGKETEEALEHLKMMIGTGCIPRTITFNNVIQAFCVEGKVGEALVVLVLMSENGKIPSRTSYDVLVQELNRQERWSCACNVYGAALKQGIFPHKLPKEYR